MDVLKDRKIEKTIILGSGESMLRLTDQEINYMNNCKTVIAVNKYMAFYKILGVIPTHIYFHDITGYNIFSYILNLCKKDQLENLTFITCPFFKAITYNRRFEKCFILINEIIRFRLYPFLAILYRLGKTNKEYYLVAFRRFKYFRRPTNSKFISINVTEYMQSPLWANSLKEEIYHYKGSISSVLNIAAIINPSQEIYLVGNDFTGSNYFYEKEIEELGIPWKDKTYKNVKDTGIHYSFQITDGITILDRFPEIIQKLATKNCKLYCTNEKSLLVTEANVEYKPLLNVLNYEESTSYRILPPSISPHT